MPSSKTILNEDNETYLTAGETWLIHRRRRGMSQQEYAGVVNKTTRQIKVIEADEGNVRPRSITPLEAHEKCFIYRRRMDLSQQDVADSLNISRAWVNRMERGEADCSRLVCFFEQ